MLSAKYIENPNRQVELDIDIGADAKDWNAIVATEKLKPVEADLRRIEEMVAEVVNEMEYLRTREQKLRDTNESTNNRVKWFGFITTFLLVALWGWQIMYLRAYFRLVLACDLSTHPFLIMPMLIFCALSLGPSISFELSNSFGRGGIRDGEYEFPLGNWDNTGEQGWDQGFHFILYICMSGKKHEVGNDTTGHPKCRMFSAR